MDLGHFPDKNSRADVGERRVDVETGTRLTGGLEAHHISTTGVPLRAIYEGEVD